MTYGLNCKFCRKPISIGVDDDYAQTNDPYKLLPLACCNFCGDLRVERWHVNARLNRAIGWLQVGSDSNTVRENTTQVLTILTKQLVRLIAKWYGVPELQWEAAIVEEIMTCPAKANGLIETLWAMGRNYQRPLV